MDDKYELLISVIQGYPHLYDKSNKHFKDQRMKENSWEQISREIETTVKDCQRIWLNLRNKYTREKKALPSGSGAPLTPQWEFFESMSFLNPYIKPRNTHTTTPAVAKKPLPTTPTLQQRAPPLQSPIVIDSSPSYCSPWSNSATMDNPVDSPAYDYSQEHNPHEESMHEDIRRIDFFEDTDAQRPSANSETVQFGSKGKSKRKNTNEIDTSKGVVDAAKSITEHLKNLAQKKQEPKTSADVLGEYIASILKEMTPEQQKIKRRRLLDVLEDDDYK